MAENPNQELVGKESPPATIHVDRARIRQFAKAVGLTDPIHYDEAEAKRQGHPSLVGPPTLPIALGQDTDPGEGGEGPRVKWNVAKLLHEGTEIQFDRPIYAGDVLTMKSMLKSISTREGRSGLRTIYVMEQAFYDQSGKRVCALLIKTSEGQ
ncbi:MAG: MaoC family dehydratase [Deltaproteobacteria bacterium]|nr:MaoC family dehydratase [Deltaproteobacteria bacterium]